MRELSRHGRPLYRAVACQGCRFPARGFATSTAAAAQSPSLSRTPPASGIAALPSRHLLSLSGPDAPKFLQGIITSNVMAKGGIPRTDPFYTAFLNATGRVLYDVFVYPYHKGPGLKDGAADPAYLIEVDANQSTVLRQYLKRYKLRSKIAIQALDPSEATVWQAWDDASSGAVDTISPNESRIVFQDPRAPGLGNRIIQLNDKSPEADIESSTQDAYTIRRYLRGVAEGQDEILREAALPQESNIDMMHGIDWHKGCYVGQELTIRTRHRGVVRKRILPCVVYAPDRAAPATPIFEAEGATAEALTAAMVPTGTSIGRDGKRGRSAGKWLAGQGNIGLALCRLETMTDVALPGEQPAEQPAAPSGPDSEFVVQWGEEDNKSVLKVKAFVPEWLRSSLTQQ